MSKILFVATVDNHIKAFHIPYIKMLKEIGNQVDVASNGDGNIPYIDNKWNISFQRNPIKKQNIKAYKDLIEVIETNKYDLIHCHTPVGSVLTRLAYRKLRDNNMKVIYTAHGFHFYKGAPLKNWLLYYPIEKWLSKYTDCLITINEEDYNIAKNKFYAKDVRLVNGVGIDLNKFSPLLKEEKIKLRNEYGYSEKDFILFYAGELNNNKNQELLFKVVEKLKMKIPNIKLLLAGKGDKLKEYEEMVAKMGLEDKVIFLGYRKDIHKLLQISDVAVSSSKREGLPVNVMEAMATGLPLVVSNCRGNKDLVKNEVNGYVIDLNNVEDFADAIYSIYTDEILYKKFSEASLDLIRKYSLENVTKDMEKIYIKLMLEYV
jgi:glycosyltransferase EpsD